MAEITVCGLVCGECHLFGSACQGCAATKGKPFWAARYWIVNTCPIYDCVVDQTSCGECQDLPCETFTNLKDPNMTDEAFQQIMKERIARLREAQS